MTMNEDEIEVESSWQKKALIVGAVAGALVGLGAAYLYVQNSDPYEDPKITPGDGVKIGLLVLGLLRSIASLGPGE